MTPASRLQLNPVGSASTLQLSEFGKGTYFTVGKRKSGPKIWHSFGVDVQYEDEYGMVVDYNYNLGSIDPEKFLAQKTLCDGDMQMWRNKPDDFEGNIYKVVPPS